MKQWSLFLIMGCFFIVFSTQIRAESLKNDVYKIGINDALQIRVIDHDELKTLATVASDGTITFPLIGTVVAKGKTISSLEEEITRLLSSGYIKYPVVNVSLLKSMSRKIYAYGDVYTRGTIPFEDDMTIIRALSVVGGITADGQFGRLIVMRKLADKKNEYKELVKAELANGKIGNREIEDTLLKPDDMLIVERNRTFLIEGETAQRGRFVLEKDMTVLRALLQAGGVTKDGAFGRIKLRRKQEGKPGGYEDIAESGISDGVIEKKEVEDIVLKPDDILMTEKSDTFLIQGEVNQRGRVVLEKDMTVLRALLQAGGVTKDGAFGRIIVRRKQEGEPGGYKEFAESAINNSVIEKKEVEDTILQPDDVLVVERNKTYFIYGEALKTGEFVLTNDETVFQALTIAGGFTKWGSESRVKVLRPSDNGNGFETIKVNIKDVIDGDATADVYLKPKDTIVVSSGIF